MGKKCKHGGCSFRKDGRKCGRRNYTANSSRAAELLRSRTDESRTATIETSSTYPTLKYMTVEGLSTIEDSKYVVPLKRMRKKDRRTRRKGAKQLRELFEESTDEEISGVLRYFVPEYCRLSLDADNEIRDEMNAILLDISIRVKKKLGVYLKQIVPYWLMSQHDFSVKVAEKAEDSFRESFPAAKQMDVIKYSLNSILELISKNLDVCVNDYVSIGLAESEATEKHEVVLTATAMTLADLISKLCQTEDCDKYKHLLLSRLPQLSTDVLIKHLYGDNIRVKAALLQLSLSLSTHLPQVVVTNFENWYNGVVYTLMEKRMSSTLPLQALRSFFVAFGGDFDSDGGQLKISSSIKGLRQRFANSVAPFLQEGCYNIEGAYHEVFMLFRTLPASFMDNTGFSSVLLSSMWEGREKVMDNNLDGMIEAMCDVLQIFMDKRSMERISPNLLELIKYSILCDRLKMNSITTLQSKLAELYREALVLLCNDAKGNGVTVGMEFHEQLLSQVPISNLGVNALARFGGFLSMIPSDEFKVEDLNVNACFRKWKSDLLSIIFHEFEDDIESDSFNLLAVLSTIFKTFGFTRTLKHVNMDTHQFCAQYLGRIGESMVRELEESDTLPAWITDYVEILLFLAEEDYDSAVAIFVQITAKIRIDMPSHISFLTALVSRKEFPRRALSELGDLAKRMTELVPSGFKVTPSGCVCVGEGYVAFIGACLSHKGGILDVGAVKYIVKYSIQYLKNNEYYACEPKSCYICYVNVLTMVVDSGYLVDEEISEDILFAIRRTFLLQNSSCILLSEAAQNLWKVGLKHLARDKESVESFVDLTTTEIAGELFREDAKFSPEVLASRVHALTQSSYVADLKPDLIYQKVLIRANWKVKDHVSEENWSFGVLPIVRLMLFVYSLLALDGVDIVIGKRYWLLNYIVGAYEAARTFVGVHFETFDLYVKHMHSRRNCHKAIARFISLGSKDCFRLWDCALTQSSIESMMDFCESTTCFWDMVLIPDLLSNGQPSRECWSAALTGKSSGDDLSDDLSIADYLLDFVTRDGNFPFAAKFLLDNFNFPVSLLDEIQTMYSQGEEADLYLLSLIFTHIDSDMPMDKTLKVIELALDQIQLNFDQVKGEKVDFMLLFLHVQLKCVKPKSLYPKICHIVSLMLDDEIRFCNLMTASILVCIYEDSELYAAAKSAMDIDTQCETYLQSHLKYVLGSETLETMLVLFKDSARLHKYISKGQTVRNRLFEEIGYKVSLFSLSLGQDSLILKSPLAKQIYELCDLIYEIREKEPDVTDSPLLQLDSLDFLFSPVFGIQRMAYNSLAYTFSRKKDEMPEKMSETLLRVNEIRSNQEGLHINVGVLLMLLLFFKEHVGKLSRIDAVELVQDTSKLLLEESIFTLIYSFLFQFFPPEYFRTKYKKPSDIERILEALSTDIHSLEINYGEPEKIAVEERGYNIADECDKKGAALLALQVVLECLRWYPYTMSEWVSANEEAEMKSNIQKFMDTVGSRVLVLYLFRSSDILTYSEDAKQLLTSDETLKLRTFESDLSLIASYSSGEIKFQLKFEFPNGYPFTKPKVSCQEPVHKEIVRLQNSDIQWRKWILSVQNSLIQAQGSIVNSILIWAQNVSKRVDKVEDCPVCYSIVHFTTRKTPDTTCPRCGKAFHRSCLFKWFSTSYKSDCPMCRYPMKLYDNFKR